jgi:hypothetical protein
LGIRIPREFPILTIRVFVGIVITVLATSGLFWQLFERSGSSSRTLPWSATAR